MKKRKTQTRQNVSCPTRTSVPHTEARVISTAKANVRCLCRIPSPSSSSTRFVIFPYSRRDKTQNGFLTAQSTNLTAVFSDDTVQPGSLVPSSFLIFRVDYYPNNTDDMFLQNAGTNVLHNTASKPRTSKYKPLSPYNCPPEAPFEYNQHDAPKEVHLQHKDQHVYKLLQSKTRHNHRYLHDYVRR